MSSISRRTPRSTARSRTGIALFEAIAALVIFATAAATLLSLAVQGSAAVQHAWESERAMAAADEFLAKVSLWPRDELDLHLGDRAEGPWILSVVRGESGLYVVTLRDSATKSARLSTALHRGAIDDAP
jgi:type II secretory pathway pseudopilin PulG